VLGAVVLKVSCTYTTRSTSINSSLLGNPVCGSLAIRKTHDGVNHPKQTHSLVSLKVNKGHNNAKTNRLLAVLCSHIAMELGDFG